MANMAQALDWAGRRLRIFPLPYGEKRPTDSFPEQATSDKEKVRLIWRDPITGSKEYNIGVLCGDGLVIIDIDTKFDKQFNRSAVDNYLAVGGHFNTLTVKTASGGFQAYFNTPAGTEFKNATNIVPGVDVRCHNGYGIAPGSFSLTSGGEYELSVDNSIADIPQGLLALLQPITLKAERLNGHANAEKAIPLYVDYLKRVEPAIEGNGGDTHTYNVACMGVIDYGLTTATVANLMREHFNPRCQPPWEFDELIRKAENAEAYGKGKPGSKDPENIFNGVVFTPPKIQALKVAIQNSVDTADALLPQDQIPLTKWLMPPMLTQGVVTIMAGPGAVGKSTFLVALACHAAVGKPFGPYVFPEPFQTMIYSPEDDRAHISGRAAVICRFYGIDYDVVKTSLKVFDVRSKPIILAAMENRKVVIPDDTIRFLSDFKDNNPDCKLMMFDPFRKVLRGLNENDNSQMNDAMVNLNAVADVLQVAVLPTHHTPKNYMQRKDLDIANPDAASGAGSIVTSARIVVNILPQSPIDIEQQGRRDELFSIGVVKNSHGPVGRAEWWERKILVAPNGEQYPAPVPTDVKDAMSRINKDYINTIGDYMMQHSINAFGVQQAGVLVQDVHALGRSIKGVAESLRLIFHRGDIAHQYVDPTGVTYTMVLDTSGKANVFTLTPTPGAPAPPRPLIILPQRKENDDAAKA